MKDVEGPQVSHSITKCGKISFKTRFSLRLWWVYANEYNQYLAQSKLSSKTSFEMVENWRKSRNKSEWKKISEASLSRQRLDAASFYLFNAARFLATAD